MTSVEPMTPRELLELASLDALALLDQVEQDIYTRSFHDAPATVQDEVLRLQAEIANDLSLLPGDEPDPQLREKVLKAVADAVERSDSTLAPLARIDRRPRSGARHDTGARFSIHGTGQFWRAATFVLAGVSLIMAYFMAMGRQASDALAAAALWNDTAKMEVLLTPPAKQWLLDDSTKVALHRVNQNHPYRGSLFVDKATRTALILLNGFPASDGEDYVLQVVMEDGEPQALQTFRTNVGFGGVRVNVPAKLIAGIVTWQIAEVATGVVLLTSA